ncbi:MAG: hypothetical protein ACOX0K_00540 [Oscillospiraceae bacterium]|jgi:hypothetical protein
MNAIIVVIICLLASVGIVQALSWLIMGLAHNPEWGTMQVVPLRNDPNELEAQLRYELFLLRWSTNPRPQHLILLDTGLDEEGQNICRRLLSGVGGINICSPDDLPKLTLHLAQGNEVV